MQAYGVSTQEDACLCAQLSAEMPGCALSARTEGRWAHTAPAPGSCCRRSAYLAAGGCGVKMLSRW